MSAGTPNDGRTNNRDDGSHLDEDEIRRITSVVHQVLKDWNLEPKETSAFARVKSGTAWVIIHSVGLALVMSTFFVLAGIFLYGVDPRQVIERSVAGYQQAEFEEQMVDRHLRLGNRLLNIGQPSVAKGEFEQALKLDPTNTDAELGMSKCDLFISILEQDYNLEIMEQRIQTLMDEVSQEQHRRNTPWYTPLTNMISNSAETSYRHFRVPLPERSMKRTSEQPKGDTHSHTLLGHIFRQSNPQKALSHYDKAIDSDAGNATAFYSKGAIYEGQGKLDRALRMYNKAHSIAKWNPLYQQAVAYVLYEQRYYKRARAKFENLVHWDPQYLWAYSDLALVYQLLGYVKIADYYQGQLVALLEDENVITLEKNRGTLAFNTRIGPMYLSQSEEKRYYVYYNAAWTSHLLGNKSDRHDFVEAAEDHRLDTEREWEIKQIIDENIALFLSENEDPSFASKAQTFRSKFISNKATSLEGVPSPGAIDAKPDRKQNAARAAVQNHYEAIGNQEFRKATSYFGPDYLRQINKQFWIEKQELYGIRSATINSLAVDKVEGKTATVTADVAFDDNSGTPRFLTTWILVKEEDGDWKLNKAFSSQRLN
jgi:tetratricopeptide (TPR) repeat protein